MSVLLMSALLAMPNQGVVETPTYHKDVAQVLETRCNGCHQVGGIGSFGFGTYDDALGWSEQIVDAVTSGRMPPWSPDEDECRPLQRSRALSVQERDVISDWVFGGAPEGNIEDAVVVNIEAPLALTEPLFTVGGTSAYVPDLGTPDDYRCIVLDHEFSEITYITGFNFSPGQSELVHHAALYLAPLAYTSQLSDLDEGQSDQVGYTCFGGPGLDFVEYIGGWVPGSGAVVFPEDSAMVIPAGAKIIMQMHYNMAAGFTAPDSTTVSLSTVEEAPTWRVKQRPMVDLDIVIPPGVERSEHVSLTPQTGFDDWIGIGVLPHMHLIGEEVKLEVVHADGSRTCLVDVPAWDFQWQETYFFQENLTITEGDELELTCVFNNSAENQPTIDGVKGDPQEVRFGEKTQDEMCVVVLTTLSPMQGNVGDTCVLPGDEGNEVGVGRYCTDIGGECDGSEADFCLGSAVEELPFCTKIFCSSDEECGEGATCQGDLTGSACIPDVCQDEGGNDEGCGCDASGDARTPLSAAALLLAGLWLGRRRRR